MDYKYGEGTAKCAACSNTVSRKAASCPKCGTEVRICPLCGETLIVGNEANGIRHDHCVERFYEFPDSLNCVHCGKPLTAADFRKEHKGKSALYPNLHTCPHCGGPGPTGSTAQCCACGGTVIFAKQKVFSGSYNAYEGDESEFYVHDRCRSELTAFERKFLRRVSSGGMCLLLIGGMLTGACLLLIVASMH